MSTLGFSRTASYRSFNLRILSAPMLLESTPPTIIPSWTHCYFIEHKLAPSLHETFMQIELEELFNVSTFRFCEQFVSSLPCSAGEPE